MNNSLLDTVKSFFSSLFNPSKGKQDKEANGPSAPVELSRPFTQQNPS